MRDLSRLLRPKSIALFGGTWAANVAAQLRKSGYAGQIWPVNPKRADIHGFPCLASIDDLPTAPDAAFVGVNREASIDIVAELSQMGAGGATCFASGFSESEGEGGVRLQEQLVEAAGAMPLLGPNCYGLLNYLDNVTLWPDQHGGVRVDRGVAIIAQSSNIAINMTMQARSLPIAYMVAAGNQAQTGVADLGDALLSDDRVTAIGLYLEGFGDIRKLEHFAANARATGRPVVVLKVGRSKKAQAAAVTHTASLSGGAAASTALLRRLGFIEVRSIAGFLETLKLLDAVGPLRGAAICSISCSGGEAGLMADLAEGTRMRFRDFSPAAATALKNELGPIVTIANPLDYHTFIWGDTKRMTRVFATVMSDRFDLCVFVLDLPRADRCDPASYQCAIDAICAARAETGAMVAVLASLPENLSEAAAQDFRAAGIAVLHGMEEGLAAIDAATGTARPARDARPLLLAERPIGQAITLTEAGAKRALAKFGLKTPSFVTGVSPERIADASRALAFPVALKALGVAHKSEAGAVVLDIASPEALDCAARRMPATGKGFLAEEMITGGLAEILVGIVRDETGLLVLSIGAGGILAELLRDTASLLLPADREEIEHALTSLRIDRLLSGWRGKPAASRGAVVDAILSICAYAEANAENLLELDVNPLIARAGDAVAVDALICLTREN
jgi:acyl-CoA synthetase (NDP forming)